MYPSHENMVLGQSRYAHLETRTGGLRQKGNLAVKRYLAGLMVATITLMGVTGCTIPRGQTPGSQDNDPYDPDFTKLPAPPDGMPAGTATWGLRVQAYTVNNKSRGGRVTVHINATTVDPRAVGGVAGGHNGPFPYDEIKSMPFQFPLYITPPIVVSVTSTFTSLLARGESLACWFTNPYGQEIPGTRSTNSTPADSVSSVQPQTVNCALNLG